MKEICLRFGKCAMLVGIIFSSLTGFAHADTPSVNVSDRCTASDGGSNSITYSQSGQFLGICALIAAQQQGAVGSYTLTYSAGFGFYLASLNSITPSATQFWDIYHNGAESSVGLSSMIIATEDTLSFQLMQCSADWSTCTATSSPVSFKIGSLSPTPGTPSLTSGGGLTLHDSFDVPRAFSYLWSKQDQNGSFGSPLLDDWVAIASAAGGAGDLRAHLSAYDFAHPPVPSSVTDFERHAMALEALGVNPYIGPTDYITPIVRAFDGTQVGDLSLDNDDIFALFPLLHAGYTAHDDIVAKTTAFIVSKQGADGSWDGNADMTAAGVQALAMVPSLPGTSDAIAKALRYLHAQEQGDGGFDNTSATSWVLQAAAAVAQTPFDWSAGTYKMPDYYLATKQELDGGIGSMGDDVKTRVWATAYAVPAIEHKSWDALLGSFPKPAAAVATSTAATSTLTSAAPITASTTTARVTGGISTAPKSFVGESTARVASAKSPALSTDASTSAVQLVDAQTAAAAGSGPDVLGVLWSVIVSYLVHFW